MKITNNSNLPEILVRACSADIQPPRASSIRVTELIDSPLIKRLKLAHWDALEDDLEDRIWALFGSAVHRLIETHAQGELVERRVAMSLPFAQITGTIDLQGPILTDWKTTSVWSIIYFDQKIKWTQQLNVYAELVRQSGDVVEGIQVVAFLKDWSRSKARMEPDYPQSPVVTVPIDLWSPDRAYDYILERAKIHADPHYVCSDEDRWHKADTWAVIKKGNKRASKVCNSPESAQEYVDAQLEKLQPNFEVVHRPGEDSRCNDYCPVRAVCLHKRAIVQVDLSEEF